MAWYGKAIKREIRPGANDPAIKPIGVILHVDAGNAGGESLFGYFRDRSGGIESHFHIQKDGKCLAPHHKVLTTDLRWVPLGDIRVGDKLVGFTENAIGGTRRKFETSVVEAVRTETGPMYAVVLEDGRTFHTTADHQWLVRNANEEGKRSYTGWRQTRPEASGSRDLTGANVLDVMDTWDEATDFESGWMAGILDGEGSLTAHHGVHVAQRPTVVLDRIQAYLKSNEVPFGEHLVHGDHDCVSLNIQGGLRENLKLLGRLRPTRLLAKVQPDNFGALSAKPVKVLAVYPIGEAEYVMIQTSTRTFIADGVAMHNCYQFRDTDREADANYKANSFVQGGVRKGYISVETQGLEKGEWTSAQIAAIKELLLWAHKTHGVPLRICRNTTDPGVGYHTLFGAPSAWTPVSKSCPGPDRKKQFHNVIGPWMKAQSNPKPAPKPTPKPPAEESHYERLTRILHQRYLKIKNLQKQLRKAKGK